MQRIPLASVGAARTTPDAALDPATLGADAVEQLHRLQADLRLGLPVALETPDAAVLVAAVETLSDERCRALANTGAAELVLTQRRAAALGAMAPAECPTLRLAVPAHADRAWLGALAGLDAAEVDPSTGAAPHGLDAGTDVQGTALDLARAARLLPAVVTVSLARAEVPTNVLGLAAETIAAALGRLLPPTHVGAARLPTSVSEAGRVHAFRPAGADTEHYAIEIGTPDLTGPVTVRLHSACFTGDVLGSLKCDCGPQLRAALATMAADGGGILLYLDQEGRGIGLANKLRAYALQDAGLDTVEANHWLGFEDDQRDFRIGAQLLHALGVARVRLMTNNPAKVEMLVAAGIEVLERVPLTVGETAHNAHYRATKAAKSGHLL